MEQMVREREEQEREQNWAEEEQSTLQALYEREREIEIEIGREDADAMAWEDEVERHFQDEMSHVCECCEVWHQRLVEEVAENRRIEEAEYDRTEVEYEMDRMWMAHKLAALDLEEKMKWIQDENEETEEIGERWDRLGPYTESDCEMVQTAIMEEEKEKDVCQPSTPVRGGRKRRRGGRLTLRKRKKVKVESVPEQEQQEKYVQHLGVKKYRIIVIICTRLV